MSAASYSDIYLQYLEKTSFSFDAGIKSSAEEILHQTNWEEPTSGLDWNNLGVIALLEAEQAPDLTMRSVFLEMAYDALQQGLDAHPLCAVHWALLNNLLGEEKAPANMTYQVILNTIATDESLNPIPKGLVYIPGSWTMWPKGDSSEFTTIFQTESGYYQVLRLASEVLWRSQLVFYSTNGLRTLQLAAQVAPNSVALKLRLGISSLVNNNGEGLLLLQQARAAAPDVVQTLQAIYIACRDQGNLEKAKHWLSLGLAKHQQNSQGLTGCWTTVPAQEPYTYAFFDEDLLLAVEPSFKSIVTSVLIAEGDWFEKEMEWWRNWIQPGMHIIDVGANVGVYTLSAAKRVGPTGGVIAVEPFSGCINCLQESVRINSINWVKIVAGAASNHDGTAHLTLNSASELNEIISPEDTVNRTFENTEKIQCFTLDGLFEQENWSHVDLIKLDAEGHELSVLAGGQKILSKFMPVILYENIAGTQGNNIDVTNYLTNSGYDIYVYQPFTERLIPINEVSEGQNRLNLIAYPKDSPPAKRHC